MDIIKTKPKMKPLISFAIDIKCDTKLGINYLVRDRPKMISKVNMNQARGNYVGNKEIHQLYQTLKNLKGTKKIILDICGYEPHQLRILAKWVKTSRNLTTLQLVFPWGAGKPQESLVENLFYLKDVKSLIDLTLEILQERSMRKFERIKSFLKLNHLCSLKKLKISPIRNTDSDPMYNVPILSGLKGLDKLDELDLNLPFLNDLPDFEIQRTMRYLKEIKNLRSLRLDSRFCPELGNILIGELVSYLSSLENLESFRLMLSVFANINPESIEKLIASVKNNPGLKNLVLSISHYSWERSEEEQLKCLNLKAFNQLLSLKLSLSANSKIISRNLLQDIAETLRQNPRLEILDLDFYLKHLTLQGFKLFCERLRTLKNLNSFGLLFYKNLDRSDKEHIKDLTGSLKDLKRLEKLNLNFHSCTLSSKSIPLLAETVESLQELKSLSLNFNHPGARFRDFTVFFKKTGLGSFGPVFQRHKHLSAISLEILGLNFTDQEFEELALGIGALKTLKSFELSSSQTCPSLNTLYQGLATNPVLSSLSLKFTEMKHQDLEILFGNLQKAKSLKSLQLDLTVESLSEKVIENFIKMIQNLRSLSSMNLPVFWGDQVDINMVLKFLDGMKYFDHYVDCSWKCLNLNPQKRERCEKALDKNSKYLRYVPSPVRYRSLRPYREYYY